MYVRFDMYNKYFDGRDRPKNKEFQNATHVGRPELPPLPLPLLLPLSVTSPASLLAKAEELSPCLSSRLPFVVPSFDETSHNLN